MGKPSLLIETLDILGRPVPVTFRRNRRARRLILRIAPGCGKGPDGVVVTLPARASVGDGRALVGDKADWIADQLDDLPPHVPLANGSVIPVLGVDHAIRHCPGGRRGVWREDGEIRVSGRAEHTPRRLADWLKREARREIAGRVRDKAADLGREPGRISLRDTRSRWGSCAPNGNLSFCWRLFLAPEFVLDYVVAHEVAHLEELHHGPAFWRLVQRLTPAKEEARAWLHRHGAALHRIG